MIQLLRYAGTISRASKLPGLLSESISPAKCLFSTLRLPQFSATNSRGLNSCIYGFVVRSTGLRQLSNKGAVIKTASKNKTKATTREISRLFGLAKDEKWKLTGAVILLFISSAVTMAVPFCMGKVIDIIYQSKPEVMKENLRNIAIALVVVFVLGAIANCGRVYLMQTTGYRITQKIRSKVYASIMKQEIGFFDKNKTGELINRLSADTALVGNSLSINISDGLRATVSILAGISMMFYTSTQLAFVGLATIPPVAALSIIYGRYIRKLTTKVQDGLAEATQISEERFSNIRTVRAFAKEDTECHTYDKKLESLLKLMYKESLVRGIFFGCTGLCGNVVVLSVLYYGGLMVSDSVLTIGDLSAFLMYAAYVGVSFGGISSAYSELMKGVGASTRFWEIVDRKPSIPLDVGLAPTSPLLGNITFDEVTFAYPTRNNAVVFDNFSLKVPAGQITAVVGSSGSGKSTLAHLLLRFYDPDSGKIFIDDNDTQQLNPKWIRSAIGTVTQEPILFSCSVRDNILYGAYDGQEISEDYLLSICREANALEFILKFPDKFNTVVGERGLMLSGGQRQRIAIARALLKNPKILLLDEATSALDAESEHLVQEALERLMKGRTVITIAHRLSTIKSANQIAVLSDGKIAEIGNYESLTAKPNGIFKKLVERQTIMMDK
ncbi:hypothetical protein CHUAL_004346 [Chamberlinius hualienensis]